MQTTTLYIISYIAYYIASYKIASYKIHEMGSCAPKATLASPHFCGGMPRCYAAQNQSSARRN